MNKKLKPNLRFPEFRKEPGWEEHLLGDLLTFGNGRDHKHLADGDVPVYGSGGYMRSVNQHLYDGESVCIGRKGTIDNPIFLTGKFWTVDTLFYTYDFKDCLPKFAYYLFNQIKWLDYSEAGGVPSLAKTTISKIGVLKPPNTEQQKIADCLSSLDELIAAEGRKLESLRTYKKNLMQQLFPRPGETMPRLRFPEFRNAGEWASQELGPKTIKVGSGITPTGGEKVYKKSGRPFIRSQNVGWSELLLDDVAYIDEDTHHSFDGTELRVDDVLLNITGASIGRSAIADSRIASGNVNQHVCIIRVKPDELNPVLLNQYLVSYDGQKQIDSFQAGGNRQGLNFAQIRSFLVPLPPTADEQGCIADCLSAMDARIVAQSKRIAALRTHKTGLMQQLFPSAEEER